MNEEKQRSEELETQYPLHLLKAVTDTSYDKGVDLVMDRISKEEKVGILISSHNFQSVVTSADATR